MRRLAVLLAASIFPALLLSAPVSAQTTTAQSTPPPSTQTTIEGRALGEHVSDHAPEHPLDQGQLFGDCVSELALTGTCPHEETDELDG